ncbi:3-hydroxyacyl-CoA dehydrogenase family protein [Micromonospora chokoriensis]|uniref:3-hydroxyacyl-CoA dehydrogenase family protein n=1 Tax=Micromonospora chokoriensis TaxID=356851 RepID=UPI0004C3A40F|nr:3-hydroxyacyl-CoA dehydrogenase family protein [Micromonospora chokoriensis]
MKQRHVTVLGAGVMGTSIAALAVGHGLPVTLVDVDRAVLERARDEVTRHLRLARLMGVQTGTDVAELRTTVELADVADADVVVEAVTELADVKAKVLAEISALIGPEALVLTNTSAIPVDELAGAVAHPERTVGAHFMNPPYLIKTVEVIRGPRSSAAALAVARDFLASMGREVVVVGDGPGFVINRVLQRMINEAARIADEGLATPEEIDLLFTGCLGHRTGPLATADLIGLDNVVDSLRVLRDRTGDQGYEPSALLLAKVADGDFGRKTGRGFYEHRGTK